MNKLLTTLEVTVMTKTKEALEKHCNTMGISYGEVIDRLVLSIPFNNPEIAAQLLCEEFVLITSNQTDEQIEETILETTATLLTPLVGLESDKEVVFAETYKRIAKRIKEIKDLQQELEC